MTLDDWFIELDGSVTFGPNCTAVFKNSDRWQSLHRSRMISPIPASHTVRDGRVVRLGPVGSSRDRKIADDDVQRLRYEYFVDHVSQSQLAKKYNLSQAAVHKIVSWKTKWQI